MKVPDTGSNTGSTKPDRDSPPRTPRWVKVFGIISLVLVLLFVILHLTGHRGFMNHSMHNGMPGMDHSGGHTDMAPVADKAKACSVKALFTLSNDKPQPNQDTIITVHIQDKDGKPIDQFDVQHEKQMHRLS